MSTQMQTSFDYNDWVENITEAQSRWRLRETDSPVIIRQYYPFSAKLIVNDKIHGHREGTVLRYARTQLAPSNYPIEVFSDENGRRTCYSSDEVMLLLPASD
jgi:hypothetical protein